ncbi:MAG: Nif3-like dinuclear metal center hexameric protein, partial [Clostridia bacterium]|nr:Nif3-like dinuclear metal center hexameric protein [Clostridia bacterium]
MKIKDIAQIIEGRFPKHYAMERDNVGLLVGDENSEISKVLV